MEKDFFKEKGFSVIEVFIGISLAAVFLTVFMVLMVQAINVSKENTKELKARMYLRELIEIARDLESSDWDLITGCSPYCYFYEENFLWEIEDNQKESLENNSYKRWILIEDVNRDSDFKITDSGGVSDDNTKKVVAYIEIMDNDGSVQRTSKLETYIYKYD